MGLWKNLQDLSSYKTFYYFLNAMLTVFWVQGKDSLPATATCVHLLSSLSSPVLPQALIYQKRSFLAPALCVSLRSLAWNIDSWNGFACNPRHQIFLTMKKDQGFVLPVGYKPMLGQNKASRWNEIQSCYFFKSENCILALWNRQLNALAKAICVQIFAYLSQNLI